MSNNSVEYDQIHTNIISSLKSIGSNNAVDGSQLLTQIVALLLETKENENLLQSQLFDLLGFENIELIGEIIVNKHVILLKQEEQFQKEINPEADDVRKKYKVTFDPNSKKSIGSDPSKEYPHVYQKYSAGNILSISGDTYSLPIGTTREQRNTFEEVTIPASSKNEDLLPHLKLMQIQDQDYFVKGTFSSYKEFNKVQTVIFPTAYNTNENILVCAPTGAGKSDIAILTILNTIKHYANLEQFDELLTGGKVEIDLDLFKIIYVAPLKALAAEIVTKFNNRLNWLGVQVKELTGDMQLTKDEIARTQIIVTTPEKWDVVTRKSNTGDSELISKVQLLIIDEVHLLNEDRGPVIETLVARTLRLVESSQKMIRIVGLSATLPNYLDVKNFLCVSKEGMFFFDQSFRPCPLEQQVIGVKGKSNTKQSKESIDNVAYDKLVDIVRREKQVMVFVNSRKDTVKSARNFIKMAQTYVDDVLFLPELAPDDEAFFKRQMTQSRDKDLKELFEKGFGVHHAGMSRSDRNLTEKMFLKGAIKVLVCTATLAWGINLPAAAVIIKGTTMYDSKKGGMVDMNISDVIQIFGRSGRPGFEEFGIGVLLTTHDKLDHYLSLLTQQHPIESSFLSKIVDNLNAEISLGTVTNVDEAVSWLGYTYLYIRMLKNPLKYGITWPELEHDPTLYEVRKKIVIEAAQRLHSLTMIVYDSESGVFISKNLGRISSDFYLLNESVEIFSKMINPLASEADILLMISMSAEFDAIKFREEEAKELTQLAEQAPCQIAGDLESQQGKTNILLQAFISKARVNDSALTSDCNYIAQNSIRICRALFLIGLNKKWGVFTQIMLELCKSIEKKVWNFDHPLAQFDINGQFLKILRHKKTPMSTLFELSSSEVGDLIRNKSAGPKIYQLIRSFPNLILNSELYPISSQIIRIKTSVLSDFKWDKQLHGKSLHFWVIVEEAGDSVILHSEKFILNLQNYRSEQFLDFMIPIGNPTPSQIMIRIISDNFLDCDYSDLVSLKNLLKPENESLTTRLLGLRPLPITAFNDPVIEKIYDFKYFNPIQTMSFHALFHSDKNIFMGAPTSSGKTLISEIVIFESLKRRPGTKIIYIAPMKALVKERVNDWSKRITPITSHKIVELTGDNNPDFKDVIDATIIITTPEKFDGISRNWRTRSFVQDVSLVIMDEVHLLTSDRGPILEMIVSRMNYMGSKTGHKVRLLGMSTAVANSFDMASWLGCDSNGLFNFPSSVRPVPITTYIDGFPDTLNFSALMKTMNKPVFIAIKQHSPEKPVVIFVASRRQTRLTAMELVHLLGNEHFPRRFNKFIDDDELMKYVDMVEDETLKLSLPFGIGCHHAGLSMNDRDICFKLFETKKIQILIATSTIAWGVNTPAHLVIIKGTEFFDAKIEKYREYNLVDVLQMMGRSGRVNHDTEGKAIVMCKEAKKSYYKHFLHIGFPVESSLDKVLDDHLGAEIVNGTVSVKQECMDFLKYTFLFRRIFHNPSFYGIKEDTSINAINKHISKLIDNSLNELVESKSIVIQGDHLYPTIFLEISSYYYISHKTIRFLIDNISPEATFKDCLYWLSMSVEYDELPVRHNEEFLNIEISKQVEYPVESIFNRDLPLWDPHIKVFLLLQAYFKKLELPIADYYQDTLTVLDQTLRITQAFIDVAAEMGYKDVVMLLVKLLQCLKQGCLPTDDFITVLPGFNKRLDLKAQSKFASKTITLQSLGILDKKEITDFYYSKQFKNIYLSSFDKADKNAFIKKILNLPVINKDGIIIKIDFANKKMSFIAQHLNKMHEKGFTMYCSSYKKIQKESWFLLGFIGSDLKFLKRCMPNKNGEFKVDISISPDVMVDRKLQFLFINDALDLEYSVPVV
ncbi:hypothetical protein QEN19_002466 [Hanseniaspora menglaensis]